MKVSVIIPVLNEEKTLGQNRHALSGLAKECHELIIVDGGSSDKSLSVAESITPITLRSLSGRARQMNTGAAVATGDVLLFLHVDSQLPSTAIEDIIRSIRAGADWGAFRISLPGRSLLLKTVAFLMNIRSKMTGIVTGDQCLFVKRGLFSGLGMYPDIPLMEDITLSAKLKTISAPCFINNKVLTSTRRWQQNGITRTIVFMWWLRLCYWYGISAERLADKYYPYRIKNNKYAILVFSKAPGQVNIKTRLGEVLGLEQRQALQEMLLLRTLETVVSTGHDVQLWATDISDPAITSMGREQPDSLFQQQGDSLGERMMNAIIYGLRSYKGVILVGTDCPELTVSYINAAIEMLEAQSKDVVIGPAEDGGYVLLGTRRLVPALFENIEWGSSSVLAQTIGKLKQADIEYGLLEELWDIDRPSDYERFLNLDLRRVVHQEAQASA